MQAAERWRFTAIVVVGILLLAALVLRLLFLQLSTAESGSQHLQQASDRRLVSDSAVPGIRGEIVDRRGNLLAYSTPTVSIGFRHGVIELSDQDLEFIADNLGLSREALDARLESNPRFVYLKRRMAPGDAERAIQAIRSSLDIEDTLFASLIDEKVEFKRFYPAGEVVSHIVGYTDVDDQGQEGIELAFNGRLSGTPGVRRTVRNARRQIIGETKLLELSKPGANVALTIDLQLQAIAHTELKAVVEKHDATSGSIVLLDVATGDVLALASQPSFNANDRSTLLADSVRNRALLDVFEPGSTVKPFTFAAGLEDGTFSMDTLINTSPGFLRIDDHAVHDIGNLGLITAADALVKSSQVGTAKLSMMTEGESIRSLFDRVGFGEYCATGFPGEQVGYLPSHRSWTGAQKAILGYGYGLEVNALQLARAYSVLGDKGRQKPVRLVKSIDADGQGPNVSIQGHVLPDSSQVMQPEVAEKNTGCYA